MTLDHGNQTHRRGFPKRKISPALPEPNRFPSHSTEPMKGRTMSLLKSLMLILVIVAQAVSVTAGPTEEAAPFAVDSSFEINPGLDRQRKASLEDLSAKRFGMEQRVMTVDPNLSKTESSSLVFVSDYFYNRHAYDSTYYVMAKVRNAGSSTLCFNKIFMDFKSSSGYVLMSDWTYITGSNLTLTSIDTEVDACLRPGETGFFGTYVTGPMGQVSVVSYHFESRSTGTATPDAQIVVASGPNPSDSYGEIKLTGSLRNSGHSDAKFVKIHACLESSSGRLLDVDMTYVDGVTIDGTDSGLHPNQSGSFTMYTYAPSSSYSRTVTKTAWDDYGASSSCSYSVSPTSRAFSSNGGSASVSVSTQSGCSWTAGESLSWVSITSGTNGTGSGTVRFSVSPNTGSNSRSGVISVAGRSVSITQDAGATSCVYSISPGSGSFEANGGTGAISVLTTNACSWTASSNSSWITVTSGASGTGSGTVNFRVSSNAGENQRHSAISVAGKTFTITQEGISAGIESQIVAGIAHAGGAGGSTWRSTLAVTNRSGETVDLRLIYRFDGGSSTRSVTLRNGRTVEWDDVATSLFNVTGASSGSVEVQSTRPVIVTSRTFNQSTNGTIGQFFPGANDSNKLSDGEVGVLPQLKKTPAFRTNIGFVNLGASQATVKTQLYSADGKKLGGVLITTIPGNQSKQENDIFRKAGVTRCEVGYATVEIVTFGSSIWAYASVVDNGTGDPTTIPVFVQ